jgi:hypothetical protein
MVQFGYRSKPITVGVMRSPERKYEETATRVHPSTQRVGNKRSITLYDCKASVRSIGAPEKRKQPCTNRAQMSEIEVTWVDFERKADSPNG